MSRKFIYLAPLIFTLLLLSSQVCFGWGSSHDEISSELMEVLPYEWQEDFNDNPADPIYGGTNKISYQFVQKYSWMCDHHDGPGQYSVETKRLMSEVIYGELNGAYAKPTPYEDGGSVETYHNFFSVATTVLVKRS